MSTNTSTLKHSNTVCVPHPLSPWLLLPAFASCAGCSRPNKRTRHSPHAISDEKTTNANDAKHTNQHKHTQANEHTNTQSNTHRDPSVSVRLLSGARGLLFLREHTNTKQTIIRTSIIQHPTATTHSTQHRTQEQGRPPRCAGRMRP